MTMKRVLLIFAILPLLLNGCGGKEDVPELPAPVIENPEQPDEPENPDNPDTPDNPGSNTPQGEWEKNRGKVVTPSGEGWSNSTVREGIIYYSFSGKDPVTGSKQNVCVVDLDLSNTKYAVQLKYSNPSLTPSAAHKAYGAIATINAGYEAGSIYIKANGSTKSMLPNTEIGSTGVRNWKSEAAFLGDAERNIHIVAAEELIRPYVTPPASEMSSYIGKQRRFYSNCTDKDIISSSPMLVNDYNPVGETFVDYSISNWSKLNSEEPQYHQRHRHPRTAVALTENNHFLMIVVDGRQSNFAEGMSAKELTQFLVKNFNPQYALNMDGGGSTAMCVEGLGDSNTHVVDVPINDNKKGNERARDTQFVIMAK